MDQHPIPRQITTFEFKLIGFMTLKQFLYLVIFFPIGYIVYSILPVPFLNILLGIVVAVIGILFAFVPIQDRPLEIWIRNFIKRLNSSTQYMYKKKNDTVSILENLYFTGDPHLAVSHVETKEKLQKYLAETRQKASHNTPISDTKRIKQRVHIDDLLQQTKHTDPAQIKKGKASIGNGDTPTPQMVHQPFITGIIKNRKNIPLPGILVSIKNGHGEKLRLLKTNPHGIFATYSPLPAGIYEFTAHDPNGNYFFDTMNILIDPNEQKPVTFYSKEIL